MSIHTRFLRAAIVAVVAVPLVPSVTAAQGGQASPSCLVRDWSCLTKPPSGPAPGAPRDLSGVWRRTRGGINMTAKIPPMTAVGQKMHDANKPGFGPRAVPPAFGNDPMGKCDPLGLTRNLFLEVGGRTFELLQTPDRVLQFFEWAHQYRTIWTDGRQLPRDPEPHWMGYSVGRWEGDTFVVDTVGLDDRSWLDMWGRPHSAHARVQERYRRVGPETLELVLRIEDAETYAAPWVSGTLTHGLMPEKGMDERLETFCVPSEEEEFNRRIRNPAAGLTGGR